MEPIKLKAVLTATAGEFFGDESLLEKEIYDISTNSREIGDNCLFIPLAGEKFDGHNFVDSAFKNGCICTLSHKKLETYNYILVDDTLKALRDIAEYYRGLFNAKIIALTGSVGKTTAKEMLYAVLSQKYNVLKNYGNFNNEIGVPKTILNMTKDHEAAIIEMGMNSLGEIHRLSKTARPDACIIMNVTDAHIGMLGSREAIFDAKCEIFDYMKEGGEVYLYGDDDMLVALNESDLNPVFFGESSYNHVSVKSIEVSDIEGTEFTANYKGEDIKIKIAVPGKHIISSVLCAIAVAKDMKLSNEQIKQGVLSYVAAKMRNDIINTGKLMIINDCYNASEESILAGIGVLELTQGRKVAILGDIREVGVHGQRVHYDVGKKAALHNVDVFICCGEMSEYTYNGLKEANRSDIYYFENKEKMHKQLNKIINDNDTVYVKASRGCKFEDTVAYLETL